MGSETGVEKVKRKQLQRTGPQVKHERQRFGNTTVIFGLRAEGFEYCDSAVSGCLLPNVIALAATSD